jgi:uncharacterized protein YegJ (DUF2314 family)
MGATKSQIAWVNAWMVAGISASWLKLWKSLGTGDKVAPMDAPLLIDALPELAQELEALLGKDGEPELATQIRQVRIIDRCRCGCASCATFYTCENVRQYKQPFMNSFSGDDAEMNAAIAEAQKRLPEFRRALDIDARRTIPQIEGSLVKARFESMITHKIEHMWIEHAGFDDDMIVGTLTSEPEDIPEHSKGDWVTVPLEAVSDWVYREGGRTFGGFTIRVMRKRGLQWLN